MISKAYRISKNDFELIKKKGFPVHGSLFSLRYVKNPENTTHFSVVVSKKVAKSAVLRNKIRRRVYSIVSKTPKKPYKIAFFAKKGAEKLTFKETEQDILKLLEKSKIC